MAGPASTPANGRVPQDGQAIVVDRRNMFILWLEEKVARRELTPAEADKMFREEEDQGKQWLGPFKDGVEGAAIIVKLARDFSSWKGARVYFSKSSAGHDLVTFKGWPAGRKIISGTRYRLDNANIIELQIGKYGISEAALKSAKMGIYIVVAIDIIDCVVEKRTLGYLLGHLTFDIPSVIIASMAGAAAGSAVATSTVAGLALIGSFAIGPLIVGFVVGAAVGLVLSKLDDHFHFGDQLGKAYDKAWARMIEVYHRLDDEAEMRLRQLAHSKIVHDLQQDARTLAAAIERETTTVRGELIRRW